METSVNAMSDDLMDLCGSERDDIEDNLCYNDADDNLNQNLWNYHDTNIPGSDEFIGRGI